MADPLTPNVGLGVPTRGSNVGVWDVPVNGNFLGLDGLLGATTNIALSSLPVTLTKPAGFVPSATPGPTQAQNAVLRFSGTLVNSLTVTLPTPGFYIIDNQVNGVGFVTLSTGVGGGEVIGIPRGIQQHIYTDGINVRFVNLGKPADIQFFCGTTAIPASFLGCTVQPYLLCDGSIYNISSYPALGSRLGSFFGGNGATTFGVPDLRGRAPWSFNGGTGRVSSGNSGINGDAIGSAGGLDGFALSIAQLPVHDHGGVTGGMNANETHDHSVSGGTIGGTTVRNLSIDDTASPSGVSAIIINPKNLAHGHAIAAQGSGAVQTNMPPSQIAGIWAIKT